MKALAITRCDKNYARYAERLKNSFKYFHSDIDFEILYAENYREFMQSVLPATPSWNKFQKVFSAFIALQRMCVDGYELIIHLDADCVVTARFDEMLIGDYEVAVSNSVRDNYPNSGVWATTSKEFLRGFFFTNWSSHNFDNSVFCFTALRRKCKWLDNEAVWYNERAREWWNRLEVRDDKLYTPDRQVKVLHWAGGSALNGEDLSCSLFSNDVKLWLNKITQTTDFTDNDGEVFGDFLTKYYRL